MAAPTVEETFAADGDAWDPADLSSRLSSYFADRDPSRTFSAANALAQ